MSWVSRHLCNVHHYSRNSGIGTCPPEQKWRYEASLQYTVEIQRLQIALKTGREAWEHHCAAPQQDRAIHVKAHIDRQLLDACIHSLTEPCALMAQRARLEQYLCGLESFCCETDSLAIWQDVLTRQRCCLFRKLHSTQSAILL
jgi:hypothetical protein